MKRALLGGVLILGTFGTVTSYGQDVSTRHLLLRGPNTTAANLGSVQVPTLTAPQTYIFPNYGGTIGVFVTPLSINSGVRTNNLGQLETVPMTAGQLLIGSNTGAPQAATLTGTTNQVIVANGDGAITLSLPQDIHTGATPTFAGATLNGLLDVTTGGATILGTTSINASGTAATNIGNTTGGSVTISVNSGTTDLILQGIASTTTATEFLTLDGTNVRARALTSFLIANNGVTYNDGGDGAFRLGGNAAGEAPFTENRFLSLAAFDLTIGGTPGDYIVIDGGATDGSVNVNSFGAGEIRLNSSNGITLDASSGAVAQNINILATSPGGQLGLSSNGQMTLNSGASDIVISVTSAGSIVDIDANGAGSSVDIDAAGSTTINTAVSSGNVTVGNTTNTVALQGGTNTITGTTDINTTGNATTTIGSLTNTGGINLRANADIVIDVVDGVTPGTPNHLVLNNIVVESPITDLLWITGSNQVRRAAFSSTANEGVIFESGSYRLGASNTTDVPLASTRYINTDGNSLILSESGVDFVEFNGSTQTVGIGKLADPEYRLDVDYSMTAGGSPEGAIRARSTNANGTPNAAVAVRATSITDGSFAYGVEATATYNGTTAGLDPNRAVSGVFGSADNGGQDIIAIGGQFDASSGTAEGGNIGVFATGSNSTSGLNAGAAFGTDGLSVGNALLITLNPTYDNVGLVSVGVNANSLGAYIEGGQEGLRVEGSQVGIVIGELNSTPVSGIEIAATSVGLLVGLGAGTPNTGISVDANNVGIDVVNAPVSYSGDGSTVFGDNNTDTHEFTGDFSVNTGAFTNTITLGNTANGGIVDIFANADVTINVGATTNDLLFANIASSATVDNILTLTTGNEVRQKAFSGLADQGISWDAGAGEFVLGGATNADVPLTTSRFINLATSNDLTISSAAGSLMVFDGDATNPSITMSSVGAGDVAITGSDVLQLAGGVTNISGTTGVSVTGPTNVNTTGTAATTIGNITTGGTVTIRSSGTNDIILQTDPATGEVILNAPLTQTLGSLTVGDGVATDVLVVNTALAADLLIAETGMSRGGQIDINPGGANAVSIDGSLVVQQSSTLGNDNADVTTVRGPVNINTTNTAAVLTQIGTSAFANTITIGNNTASNTTNLNSPVITAPNLPAGANTDNLVTITGAGAVRSTSIATAIGNTAWLIGGNSLGAAGTVGTNDAFDFSIETNGATRMTFGSTGANAGNVGLGTTADNEARFDVSYTGQTGGPRTGIRSNVASSGTGVGAITGVRGSSTGAGANTYGLSGSATFAGTVGVFTGAEKAVGVIASAQTGGQAIFGLGAELFSEQATTDGVNVGALTYAAGSGQINIGLAGGTNSTAMAATLGTLYAGPTLNVGVFAHNNTGGAGDFALYAEGPSNLNGAVSISGATTANGAVTANADVTLNNAINMPVEIGAAPTAINATAVVFIANGGVAGDDLTLPAAPSDGRVYIIRNASGVALDVAAGAGDSIEGAAVLALANGVSVKVIYVDATNTWYQIGN